MWNEMNLQTFGFTAMMERFSSKVSLSRIEAPQSTYNFLSFLATAQALGVSILPISWNSARGEIGRGGTSKVNQALANLQMSFAFKRVTDDERFERSEGEIYQSLINEMTVLSHRGIREHSNIARLQGICWDTSDSTIWPVLVFEKSQFGDLFSFARTQVGRELDSNARLKLCIEIGKAVMDMHSQNIIHGDLKPQNVLIFKDRAGTYTAKVIDFGYSTRYADDENAIGMPISWAWTAPEHIRLNQRWTPFEARKMDTFSLGMLCLWLLFEESLSGGTILLEAAGFAGSNEPICSDDEQSIAILEAFKREKRLPLLVRQLLEAEGYLSLDKKYAIKDFFGSVLDDDPKKRDLNVGGLFNDSVQLRTGNSPLSSELKEMESIACDTEFQIETSIMDLYVCDYRIRSQIAKCLEERLPKSPGSSFVPSTRNVAYQVALCYELGFGVERDDHKSMEALHSSGRTGIDIEETLNRSCKGQKSVYESPGVRELAQKGHLPLTEIGFYYLERGKLEEAELRLIREMRDLELSIGEKSYVTLSVRTAISSIWVLQKRWEEAEAMQKAIVQTSMEMGLSPDHPSLLTAIGNLAFIFQQLGDWKNAERLQLTLMETNTKALDAGHISSLDNMGNLAGTYRRQGRLDDAERLEFQIVELSTDLLGADHPATLLHQHELAWTYKKKGRWEDAERLEIQTLEMSTRVLGGEHPTTLTAMSSLAHTVAVQGRWEEAERQGIQIVEGRKKVLGTEHPDTVAAMDILEYVSSQNDASKRRQLN